MGRESEITFLHKLLEGIINFFSTTPNTPKNILIQEFLKLSAHGFLL